MTLKLQTLGQETQSVLSKLPAEDGKQVAKSLQLQNILLLLISKVPSNVAAVCCSKSVVYIEDRNGQLSAQLEACKP